VLGLTRRLATCFQDSRDPTYTVHRLETLLMQRIVGIALGYEDLNDHDELRQDPVMAALAGRSSRSSLGLGVISPWTGQVHQRP
jgi:hypothetical protein